MEILRYRFKAADNNSGSLGVINTDVLSDEEKNEFEKVRNRLVNICAVASKNNIGVLIDAEETWIQDPVDAIAMQMMEINNIEKTIQSSNSLIDTE